MRSQAGGVAAKADKFHWRFMPDQEYGSSILAIVCLVAAHLGQRRSSTPLERVFQFATGPHRTHRKLKGDGHGDNAAMGSEEKPSRKQRNRLPRQIWTENPGLDVVHPHAAGIDVGSSEHYVAIAADAADEPVQRFNCFTSDLRRLAGSLKGHGIRSVAMQSTGVYWIPLYDVLEEEGFEVYLVKCSRYEKPAWAQDRRAREVNGCSNYIRTDCYEIRSAPHPKFANYARTGDKEPNTYRLRASASTTCRSA